MLRAIQRLMVLWTVCAGCSSAALGWGEPHKDITRAALGALTAGEREWLGPELEPLWNDYCLIPDRVFTDRANARYATLPSKPGEVYLKILHLPTEPLECGEVLRHFLGQAVDAVKEGRKGDAARYLGTLCHLVEDYGSPSHVLPGDNQFQLLQQFLPPPAEYGEQLLHGLVENGRLQFTLDGYKPRLLGETVPEIAWRAQHRIHEAIVNARSVSVPVVEALYARDSVRVTEHQLRAARIDAEVVADLVHTVLAVGAGQVAAAEREAVASVGIGSFWPLEAPNLYYPQSTFFSAPEWGPVTHGYVVRDGKRQPLILKLAGVKEAQVFGEGIAAGGRSTLSYWLPPGVFQWLEGTGGLHGQFGVEGVLEFRVMNGDAVLWQRVLRGDEPAVEFRVPVGAVDRIRLEVAGKGGNPRQQYGIWGRVRLVK
jgi:hypothetical protein